MLTILVAQSWKLLTDHRPDGDGLVSYGLLSRLARRGHRLHVVCRGVDLRTPPPPGMELHSVDSGDEVLGGRRRVQYMRALRRAYDRLHGREALDLVHQPNPVDVGVTLALPRSAPPLVLGPYWPSWPSDVGGTVAEAARGLLRAAQQRRAAAVLLTSEAARSKVHVRRVPTAIVPPGIDLERLAVVGPAPAGRPPTALFFANLRGHKGIFTLLDAWDAVAAALPEARLLVAGGGPEADAVNARVARSPARHTVELLGRVEPDRISDLMRRADVFCHPAHGEPFGTSAVEAMASGLPVVATNAGGLAHVVPDAAGLKVPPADAAALADALLALLRDPARRAAMGAAGRGHVERTYAWDRVIDALEAALLQAARARRR
jgi:glycosyltransferase involved in cell wall biosynthesis